MSDTDAESAHLSGTTKRVLERGAWSDIAKRFVFNARPDLKNHNDEFFDYDGGAYVLVSESTLRSEARWYLADSFVKKYSKEKKGFVHEPFNPTNNDVRELVGAIRDHRHLDNVEVPCPSWLPWHDGPTPPPGECINFPNGILHVPTGDFLEPTPNFFTRNVTDFEYDPNAPEPRLWLSTLKQYWPEEADADCISTLQEWFGYCLTPETKHHKMLALTGPLRAGKGVISRTLEKIVGKSNSVSTSLDAFGSEFGMAPLIGKLFGTVAEAIPGGKADIFAMVRNLLQTSGGDALQINRKHGAHWDGRLIVRLMWLCNVLPKFPDPGGALTNRLLIIPMVVSFLGRENPDLEAQLESELPGILMWALEGLKRLNERGRFVQPQSGRDLKNDMAELASPVTAFVAECCELKTDAQVNKDDLYTAWKIHCANTGNAFPGPAAVFFRDLNAAYVGKIHQVRPRNGGGRVRLYLGIRLVPATAARVGSMHAHDVPEGGRVPF